MAKWDENQRGTFIYYAQSFHSVYSTPMKGRNYRGLDVRLLSNYT